MPEPTGLRDGPLIVVGCARSGTTMLQLMLDRHPRIAIPSETRFLMGLYRKRGEFGDLRDDRSLRDALRFIARPEALLSEWPTSRKDVAKAVQRAPRTVGSVAGAVFAAYAAETGKTRWGDKRPNHIRHIPQLLAMFPDAQVVHIIRDGRDCVSSLLSVPWWKHGPVGAAYKWREAMDIARSLQRTLPPDQYIEVSYEALVRSPEAELESLCTSLGERYECSMIDFHVDSRVARWRTWHSATTKPLTGDAIGRWRRDLAPEVAAFVEHAAGDHLQARGYEVSTVADPPRDLIDAWPGHVDRREAVLRKRQRRDRRTAQNYPFPVQAALTTGQRQQAEDAGWLADFVVQPSSGAPWLSSRRRGGLRWLR